MQAVLEGVATEDLGRVARALVTLGATSETTEYTIDVDAFARDLRGLFDSIREVDLDVDLRVGVGAEGVGGVEAVVDLREGQINQINRVVLDLVRVAETYGLQFPREFGLLLKQVLYFDRYVQVLSPQLEMLNDDRIRFE